MNKSMIFLLGCAVALFATAANVQARGAATGRISSGPVAIGGMGSPGAQAVTGMAAPLWGKGASDSQSSLVHGYNMSSAASLPAPGSLQRNANGSLSHAGSVSPNLQSGLLSQIRTNGLLGMGNSLGSMKSSQGMGVGGGKGKVNSIVKNVSATGSANGKNAKTLNATGSGKSMTTTLGSTRSARTGEVCIWSAGADGSCH